MPEEVAEFYSETQSFEGPTGEERLRTRLLTPAETTALTFQSQNLMIKPFFSPLPLANGHAALLAQAIPARTNPAGRNPVAIFEFQEGNDDTYNFDMAGLKSSWHSFETPQSRWLHSDIKDVAYIYTWRVYEAFINIAELNQ